MSAVGGLWDRDLGLVRAAPRRPLWAGVQVKCPVSFLLDYSFMGQTGSSCLNPSPQVAAMAPRSHVVSAHHFHASFYAAVIEDYLEFPHPISPALSCLLTLLYVPSAYIPFP